MSDGTRAGKRYGFCTFLSFVCKVLFALRVLVDKCQFLNFCVFVFFLAALADGLERGGVFGAGLARLLKMLARQFFLLAQQFFLLAQQFYPATVNYVGE